MIKILQFDKKTKNRNTQNKILKITKNKEKRKAVKVFGKPKKQCRN